MYNSRDRHSNTLGHGQLFSLFLYKIPKYFEIPATVASGHQNNRSEPLKSCRCKKKEMRKRGLRTRKHSLLMRGGIVKNLHNNFYHEANIYRVPRARYNTISSFNHNGTWQLQPGIRPATSCPEIECKIH